MKRFNQIKIRLIMMTYENGGIIINEKCWDRVLGPNLKHRLWWMLYKIERFFIECVVKLQEIG